LRIAPAKAQTQAEIRGSIGGSMNRSQRTELAQETLTALENGFYRAPSGKRVSIAAPLKLAVEDTALFRPNGFPNPLAHASHSLQTIREVTGETTLQAAERLSDFDPLCLNFASAKNPGGGFLSGSQAQEESLARSSGLYACLLPMTEMYDFNRQVGTCLYSDYMLYSPRVPVFRRDDGQLREQPFCASFVTAPAVNAGAVTKNEPQNIRHIRSTMAARANKFLWLAHSQGHKTLVLGAWGCGVFGNEPSAVAQMFSDALGPSGPFHGTFERVVFAVYDPSPSQETKSAFERVMT
jgi:uncharacterized protein (TIGR02452 family)